MKKLLLLLIVCLGFTANSQDAMVSAEAFEGGKQTEYVPYLKDEVWYIHNIYDSCFYDTMLPFYGIVENSNYFKIKDSTGKFKAMTSYGYLNEHAGDEIYSIDSYLLFQNGNQFSWGHEYGFDDFIADSIYVTENGIYHYLNNKVGFLNFITNIPIKYDAIMPINSGNLNGYLTLLSGKYGYIDLYGKEIIRPIAAEIQSFQHGIKYLDGTWQYITLEHGSNEKSCFLNSEGLDVLFYSDKVYKKYTVDRKSVSLFENGQVKFSGQQDCGWYGGYSNKYWFKQNDRIGLLNQAGKVIVSPRYEQITFLGSESFAFRLNGLSAIGNENGKLVTEHLYTDVRLLKVLPNSTLFTAYKNGKKGIVNSKGKEITPFNFEQFEVNNQNILFKRNGKIGKMNFKGEIIFNEAYSKYKSLDITYDVYRFKNGSTFDVWAGTRKLNKANVVHVIAGNNVFKIYTKEGLEIHTFDIDGNYLGLSFFPGIKKVKIGEIKTKWFEIGNDSKSYLEENQLNGLYGAKSRRDTSYLIPPEFNDLQVTPFSNTYVVNKLNDANDFKKNLVNTSFKYTAQSYILFASNGEISRMAVNNSNIIEGNYGLSNTDRVFNNVIDNSFETCSRYRPYSHILNYEVTLGKKSFDYHYQYYFGGALIEANTSSSFTNTEVFKFNNGINNFWFQSIENAQYFMNPKLNFTFKNGFTSALGYSSVEFGKHKISPTQKYERLENFDKSFIYSQLYGSELGKIINLDNDTNRVDDIYNVIGVYEGFPKSFYTAEQVNFSFTDVSPLNPDFEFYPTKNEIALWRNVILTKRHGYYGLKGENGLIPNQYDTLYRISSELAIGINENGKDLIHTKTLHLTAVKFDKLLKCNNEFIIATQDTFQILIDAMSGEEVLKGKNIAALDDNYMECFDGIAYSYFDFSRKKVLASEFRLNYLGSGFYQDKKHVISLGDSKKIKVKSAAFEAPFLTLETSKSWIVYSNNLMKEFSKDFQIEILKEEGLLSASSKGEWYLYNQDFQELETFSEVNSIETNAEFINLSYADTNEILFLQNYKSKKLKQIDFKKVFIDENDTLNLLGVKKLKNGFTQIKTEKGFNLLDENDNLLLNKFQPEIEFRDEFLDVISISAKSKLGVINSDLNQFLPPIYDEVQFLENHFLVRRSNRYSIYDRDGEIVLEF